MRLHSIVHDEEEVVLSKRRGNAVEIEAAPVHACRGSSRRVGLWQTVRRPAGIEGELQGIAGRIDQMTRAKQQFDSGVDELSDAIVKNHIESVGLDAMMQAMRENQAAQKEMARYREMARNEPVPTRSDFDTLNAIRGADQKYERFEYGEDALARFDELMNSGKSLPDYIEVNTGDGYRVIDVARDIPEFAPFTRSSRTEIQRRDIQRGIKALGMP